MDEFYTTEKKDNSHFVFKMTLPQEAFKQSYEQMLKQELEKTNVKGFRKGKFPTDMLEKQIKPALIMETFQRLAPYYVNAAIIKEKLEPVAPPKYENIGKLDNLDNPITFEVEVVVMPEFKLGKLNKIKPETKEEKATKEDIDKTLQNMFDNNSDKAKAKEINDEWAKEVAKLYKFDGANNLAELRKMVEEVITEQKAGYIRQAQEAEVLRKAVKASKIEIPDEAMHHEAHEREHAFEHDLEHMKMTMEEFAKQRETTVEEMRDKWHKDAQEALENDVLFKTYAREKGIEVSDEELEAEIEKIKVANANAEGIDEKVYEDEGWKNNARNFVLKQKAYRAIVDEILGEYKPVEKSEKANSKKEDKKEKTSNKKTKKSTAKKK